jgi:hypothetical protein
MVNYDNYFNKYSKVSKSNINDVVKILEKFKKYLDTIYLNISEFKPNTNYDNIIETLKTYMNIIYNYYDKIEISELENNININYQFIDVMTIAIIILYSYIFFNDKTKIIKNKKDTTFKFIMHKILIKYYAAISSPINKKTLYKFKIIIYNNKPNQKSYIIDFINKISKFNKIKPSNKRYFTIPQYTGICWFIAFIVGICYSDKNKELLIKKFNSNKKNYKKDEPIANLSAKQIFTTLIYRIIKEITENGKRYDEIDGKTINELNIYLKETPIKFLIKLMNEYYYNPNKDDYSKEYIFIKDYINEMQFNLTTKYFIKKIKIINNKIKEKEINKNDIRKDIIKLKEIYPYDYYYFYHLFDNYKKLFNSYILDNFLIVLRLRNMKPISINKFKKITGINYKPLTIDNYKKLGDFGLATYDNIFLKALYKFLNINCLYLIKTKNKFYTCENNNTIPDIILISIDNDNYIIDNISLDIKEIIDKITYESTDIIYYKGHKYAIDYILHGSDQHNSWDNSGHIIVAINYNNEEYLYDSSYFIKKYIHKNKTLRYSCPLLKKEWKKDFVSSKKTKFCIKKCFHTNLNHKSKIHNDYKHVNTESMCYTFNNEITCCYVKVI